MNWSRVWRNLLQAWNMRRMQSTDDPEFIAQGGLVDSLESKSTIPPPAVFILLWTYYDGWSRVYGMNPLEEKKCTRKFERFLGILIPEQVQKTRNCLHYKTEWRKDTCHAFMGPVWTERIWSPACVSTHLRTPATVVKYLGCDMTHLCISILHISHAKVILHSA